MKEGELQLVRIDLRDSEILNAYNYAKSLLGSSFKRIKESDFIGTFGTDKVRDAQEYVEKKKSKFKDLNTKAQQRGDIMEAVFLDLMQNTWFPGIKFIRSSEYDDYKNGVDSILTKNDPNNPSGMGISLDPTISVERLKNKAEIISRNNGLTNIDFFAIPNSPFKGALDGAPHIALYLDSTDFSQLVRLWYNLKFDEKMPPNLKKITQAKILNHPAQLDILFQIKHQLELSKKKLEAIPERTEREQNGLNTIKIYLTDIINLIIQREIPIKKFQVNQLGSIEGQKAMQVPGFKRVQEIFK